MSMRTTARAVGTCFLLAFVFYIAGGVMVDSGSLSPSPLCRATSAPRRRLFGSNPGRRMRVMRSMSR